MNSDSATFTFVHVVISLLAILAGAVVVYGMLGSRRFERWTALFLATTVATCVTGFFFHRDHLLPSHAVGLVTLAISGVAIAARYGFYLAGAWRWIYAVSAAIALYFSVFVLVFQLFLKVPGLKALAPTQSEPPFAIAQITVMLAFVVITVLAVRKFHPQAGAPPSGGHDAEGARPDPA